MSRSAFKSPLGFVRPEIPKLVPEPPTGEGWIHEIKYDGYRTLIAIDRGQVRAFTRNGNDWTTAYKRVVTACTRLACKTAVIDGEVIVQDEQGVSDFQALRSAIYTAPHRLVFFAFDLLHLDSQDLRGRPLMERRALLRKLIKRDPWLKVKNMVEGEFILLGTDRDSDGVPWALLASDRNGRLEFAGPAI
jgi:bifunctional non-homologous end joining protein LigD